MFYTFVFIFPFPPIFFFPYCLIFNRTWILNIPCKISNLNVHKCHVLAAFTFHFHQIAGWQYCEMIMTMMMMLMRPVWVQWADWYFSVERGEARRRFIELERLYQCCVPLLVRGVCTDSWNTGNKFCQWQADVCVVVITVRYKTSQLSMEVTPRI